LRWFVIKDTWFDCDIDIVLLNLRRIIQGFNNLICDQKFNAA